MTNLIELPVNNFIILRSISRKLHSSATVHSFNHKTIAFNPTSVHFEMNFIVNYIIDRELWSGNKKIDLNHKLIH